MGPRGEAKLTYVNFAAADPVFVAFREAGSDMRVAVKAGVAGLCALAASCAAGQASCITEPIDRSERAEAVRSRAIADFVRREIIYKIVKTNATAVEVQITPRFLDLPFDMKQAVAWSVF